MDGGGSVILAFSTQPSNPAHGLLYQLALRRTESLTRQW